MATLRARLLSLPPDPIDLARRVEACGLGGVCLLHSAEAGTVTPRYSYVTAAPVGESHALDPFEGGEPSSYGELARVPRFIGILPYEGLRGGEREGWRRVEGRGAPLTLAPHWLRFSAVLRIDAEAGEVVAVGETDVSIDRLVRAASTPVLPPRGVVLSARDADAPEHHLARVKRAVERILDGDLYQVNVARKLDVELEGEWLDAYGVLATRAPAAFGAALAVGEARILSTSPELMLRGPLRHAGEATAEWIYTEPIKGTRPRGRDATSDAELAAELDADPKERAELAMILDVERNDLGSVARLGSVLIARPPTVVTHRTVHHRKALLLAAKRPEVTREELLRRLLPSGSVTGAPKVRAMEAIADLEAHRRGLYTGAFGYAAYDGSFTLAMAIRTAVLRGAATTWRGEYFTGGGIVADSDPERELEETRWKALQVGVSAR